MSRTSNIITLVIVSILGYTMYKDRSTTYNYNNLEDCKKDWSDSQCQQSTSTGGTSGLRSSQTYSVTSDNKPNGSHYNSITRGGFGSGMRFFGG